MSVAMPPKRVTSCARSDRRITPELTLADIRLDDDACGQGASGIVYRGTLLRDPSRVVAVKFHRASRTCRKRDFRREIANLKLVQRLPRGVPRFLGEGLHKGRLYYVMSWSDDLRGPYSRAETLRIIDQLIDILIAFRRLHLVHGDIKPENLGIDGNGNLVLRDYGTLRTSYAASLLPRLFGTLFFQAPEPASSDSSPERREIFAVGATFYCIASRATRVRYGHALAMAYCTFPYERPAHYEDLRAIIHRTPRRIELAIRLVGHLRAIARVCKTTFLFAVFLVAVAYLNSQHRASGLRHRDGDTRNARIYLRALQRAAESEALSL